MNNRRIDGAVRGRKTKEAGNSQGNLRLLVIEDSENDAALLALALRRHGFRTDYKRIDSRAAMKKALLDEQWDAIVADYVVPGFGAIPALQLVRKMRKDIPFLVVSGVMGEERAVEAMRAGAHDYLLKSRLARLGPAIEREIREASVRRARNRAEAALVRSTSELADHKTRLEHKDIALSEVLSKIEAEKEHIRSSTSKNVERIVMPALNRLRNKTDEIGRKEIDMLKASLRDMVSDQNARFSAILAALSPRQFEICNMIRGGMGSKDIAASMGVSIRTVETQRNVIRKKLGLSGKSINLVTHLQNLR